MSMLRNIFAVIAGIATFVVAIMLVQQLGHQVYPPPTDINVDFGDPAQVRAYMATQPVGALLFVGFAWMVGAFGGTLVATKTGTLKPLYFGVIIGGLVLAGAITNLFIIPHPVWFNIAGPVAILLATYAAIALLDRSKQ